MLRFLRRLLKTLAILVGVVLVYMAVAGRDIPPPDVSDLLVERVEIPPEENAYTYFIAATASPSATRRIWALSTPWV